MPLPRLKPPPPLIAPRDALRLLAALSMMVFLLWAISRTKNPRTWSWVENMKPPPAVAQEPEVAASGASMYRQTVVSQAVGFLGFTPNPFAPPAQVGLSLSCVAGFEHVPLSEPPRHVIRNAPVPESKILDLAIDRKGFLTDDPNESDYLNAVRKGDADARYYLLELAALANPVDLAKDARHDVRHTALMQKPQEYRGEVIHVQGQLRWLKTLELTRTTIPGVSFVYEGLITVGQDAYWVLFKDLPPGLPPAAQWNNLYVHDVRFNGYFLKVLLAKNAKGSFPFPLLIGRTLELPPTAPETSLESSFWILAIAVCTGAALLVVVFWLHGVSERRYAKRLAEVRAKGEAARRESEAADGGPSTELQDPNNESPNDRRYNDWQRPSEN